VVRGEPHVVGGGHDLVRDHPAFQTAHPVGEHHTGNPTQVLEALREQRQRRLGALVVGEPHEPHPRPRQHRAEHVQPAQHTPVDDQMLTRGPHRRPAATMVVVAPQRLACRHQPPEVSRRPFVARRPDRREQALRGDLSLGLLHPLGHQVAHQVVVAAPRRPGRRRPAGLVAGDHPLHRLRRGAAERGRATVRTHLSIGGNDVHPFPRRLQWSPLGGVVTGWHRHRHRPGPKLRVDTTSEG
jgi:hypothetical protein